MSDNSSINEQEITALLADKNRREAAFSAIIKQYSEPLYWHIRRMVLSHDDANDLLQNTFLKAWSNIDKFRGESQISTWLYRIAFNTFMNHTRSAACQTTPIDDERTAYEIPDESPPPCRQEEALQNAICLLNEKERHCITLFYLEEMSIKEIQKITGYPAGSIKAYLSRGRNNLKKILKSDERER